MTLPLTLDVVHFLMQGTPTFDFSIWCRYALSSLNGKNLGLYLGGLIEGDGCFDKSGLEIAFDLRDYSLACRIALHFKLKPKKVVIYRPPREDEHKGSWRLCVRRESAAFHNILSLVNGCFVGEEKLAQIKEHELHATWTGSKKGYVPWLELLPPCETNATGFWISGFFAADGSVFITSQGKVTVSFCQKERYLLDLIARRFGLSVQRVWREKRQRYEHYTRTNDPNKLADLFLRFHMYPCFGIKQGQLFFAKQGQVVKMQFYNRSKGGITQQRSQYMVGFQAIIRTLRVNLKHGRLVYNIHPNSPEVSWPKPVLCSAVQRRLWLLSRLSFDARLRHRGAWKKHPSFLKEERLRCIRR